MKICDDRNEAITFGDIGITELFEESRDEGRIYMKIYPVIVAESVDVDDSHYNAVNVETGFYAKFLDDEKVVPVHGSFHREGSIND